MEVKNKILRKIYGLENELYDLLSQLDDKTREIECATIAAMVIKEMNPKSYDRIAANVIKMILGVGLHDVKLKSWMFKK